MLSRGRHCFCDLHTVIYSLLVRYLLDMPNFVQSQIFKMSFCNPLKRLDKSWCQLDAREVV